VQRTFSGSKRHAGLRAIAERGRAEALGLVIDPASADAEVVGDGSGIDERLRG